MNINDLKLPPHNLEAEKWCISCCITDNDLLYLYQWATLLANDFYHKEHTQIYEAIDQLWQQKKTIDIVTISNQLNKNGHLEIVWWLDYLYELSTYSIIPTAGLEYAKIVKEKSILRNILKTCQLISGDVYAEKDTIDIINDVEKRIFELTQLTTTDKTMHIRDILNLRIEQIMEVVDNPASINDNKVLSGYTKIDDLLSWFKGGDLSILAARPSMGKTAFALNLLINASMHQKKTVILFSLEMWSESIVDRIISTVSTIPMGKLQKGQLDENDFATLGDTIEKLWESQIYIDDQWGTTLNMIRSKLRKIKIEKWSLDLVIIDYLQMMSSAGSKYAGNKVQETAELSRWLKEIAKELKVPILALSQLSRESEKRTDKRPQLSDLRESGAIEQDADTVMMLYREDYYDSETDRKGTADVLIRKNRNGPTWDVELFFHKATMRFNEKNI
jgi:replicative DNA helicase